MNYYGFILLCLLVGCSSTLSQQEAEQTAINFAQTNVKYFTVQGNQSGSIEQPSVQVLASAHVNNEWRVLVKVYALINNTEKKKGLKMVIDDKVGRLLSASEVNFDALLEP